MGNSGSSHQQQCASNGLSSEMGRGWTHSFPRELTRHHSQPPGHKVLPEPPNQRLRATNNGSIIHNGGTISGRRPSALTLPHDLNKQGAARNRSSSASNLSLSRTGDQYQHQHHQLYLRRHHHQNQCRIPYCGHCRTGEVARNRDNEICSDLKRFGSEPDLRYPLDHDDRSESRRRPDSLQYPDRDTRERESRYRSKKKYKAPPPPAANGTEDGSSPDSFKWERDRDDRDSRGGCRTNPSAIYPPPRRSRLFKTRAETKKTQVKGNCSSSLYHPQVIVDSSENERRRLRQEVEESSWQRAEENEEATIAAWSDCRASGRKFKSWEGKNTLQRSMSSPEFQAELMQVAKKVRTKLQYSERGAPVGEAVTSIDRKILPGKNRGFQDISKISRLRLEEIRTYEKRIIEDSRKSDRDRLHEERSYSVERERLEYRNTKNKDSRASYEGNLESKIIGRSPEEPHHPRLREKSLEKDERLLSRKPLRERSEIPDQGWEDDKRKAEEDSKARDEFKKSQERLRSRSSDSPLATRHMREKMEVRGQGSGRESTPESSRTRKIDKENSDPRRRKENSRERRAENSENGWQEPLPKMEKKELKREKGGSKIEEERVSRSVMTAPAFSKPKTFYFGMDNSLAKESEDCVNLGNDRIQASLDADNSMTDQDEQKSQNGIDDISLKLRPTLPKKQPEIPRFSPSAAWRLLSALETPGPTMSTVSEEIPVMFEERIERLSRPPPPMLVLQDPRSSHDKSGDSGISGDAGAVNDDSLDVGSPNRIKPPALRPTWTPQQDLGEDSSSDAGLDSPPPPPLVSPIKFPTRPHVFSLSLPREESRLYPYNPEPKNKDIFSFNSLQKLKRSVSGALGFSPFELEKKRISDRLDDNWLLSISAPTSLQHIQMDQNSPKAWESCFNAADEAEDEEEEDEIPENKPDFPVVMKTPSFSYLASGGHVMYLPDSRGTAGSSLNGTGIQTRYKKNEEDGKKNYSSDTERSSFMYSKSRKKVEKSFASRAFSKSCENITYEAKRVNESPERSPENLQDKNEENRGNSVNNNAKTAPSSKSKRFTFQSTVRQIERRRLAERLSREAEAKERQRKNELEAMRKVEEEFQRKRAREKANIRQQLRLYSMDENISSLPTIWDSSQVSRAEPDGAPSSSASSPTSALPGKHSGPRKNSASSDEYHRKLGTTMDSRRSQNHREQREYKDYRPKYYGWTPESSSHVEYKQTTVHPKVVYDIPKSSPVFVDANAHVAKPANLNSTPRADNYRKDFAHGAVAARSSLASSDSEISQPNTRPHSTQTSSKYKPLRSRF